MCDLVLFSLNENGRFGAVCDSVSVEVACFGDKDARLNVFALRRARDMCAASIILDGLIAHEHRCLECKE